MKTRILFLMLFVASYGFSQSVNGYKAVVIPIRYEFQNAENQYRLQTITKFNLQKSGFQGFYTSEQLPVELNDRCGLLYLDVKKDNAFLVTKLYITFRDCNNKLIFQSEVGKSREKDFGASYAEALNEAFKSVIALEYKYDGAVTNSVTAPVAEKPVMISSPAAAVATLSVPVVNVNVADPNLLYAQPIENGFQLIDKTPKVVMKLLKTSRADSFIAIKDGVQGTLNAKDNQWFFEYYKDDKLVSEKVLVKF